MWRVARATTQIAVGAVAIALVVWPVSRLIAAPAFVVAAASTVLALFTGFRSSHLRDIERARRRD